MAAPNLMDVQSAFGHSARDGQMAYFDHGAVAPHAADSSRHCRLVMEAAEDGDVPCKNWSQQVERTRLAAANLVGRGLKKSPSCRTQPPASASWPRVFRGEKGQCRHPGQRVPFEPLSLAQPCEPHVETRKVSVEPVAWI